LSRDKRGDKNFPPALLQREKDHRESGEAKWKEVPVGKPGKFPQIKKL
jgi:hypothetical protein